MMFKVVFTGFDGFNEVVLQELSLPFVPFKGLMLDYPTFTAIVGDKIVWNGEHFEVKLSHSSYMKKPDPELVAAFK